MDVKSFIESGILEEYCLGLLSEDDNALVVAAIAQHPAIKAELHAIELTLEEFATAAAVVPAEGIKNKMLAAIGFGEGDKTHTPDTNKYADLATWLAITDNLIPEFPEEDFIMHELRKDDFLHQMLVITKSDVPEEQHGDYRESFFILKGQCECTVGDQFFTLNPGDFLEIPLHVPHNIKITSPHVAAILQYQFI